MNKPRDKTQPQAQKSEQGPTYFQALSPYTYTNRDGEEKTGWTEVGIGWPSKDKEGVNIELRPGISVSGRIVLRPGKAKEGQEEREVPTRFKHDLNTPMSTLV